MLGPRTGAGNNAASKTASSRPSGNGQDTLASPARRKYSRTAVLDTQRCRRSPAGETARVKTQNFSDLSHG